MVMHNKCSYAYVKGDKDCTESKYCEESEDHIAEEREYQAEAKENDDIDSDNNNGRNDTAGRKDWMLG